MTKVCEDCKYKTLCIESGYSLDCTDQLGCDHYSNYLEGEEYAWFME